MQRRTEKAVRRDGYDGRNRLEALSSPYTYIVIPLTGWLLICLLGPKLMKFFMPFVIGWVIAMIANPLVRFLERRVKLVRRHSSIVIVAAALALVIGLLYLLVSRTFVLLRQFIIDLPGLTGVGRCGPQHGAAGAFV